MSESQRFYDESFAGSEYTHDPCTSSRQGQARNPATRARGRRGRSVGATNLGEEDLRRVLSLQAQTAAYEQAKIRKMSLDQSHQVLELCLTRDPSLMFDVLQRLSENAPPTGPPVSGQLTWCVCQRCREMPTFVEKKCCGQHPEYCVSMLPHMEAYILQEGVLRLARRIWNDIRALADLPDPGQSN